jgi:hypothetical protein
MPEANHPRIFDGITQITHCWLTVADRRDDGDAIEPAHVPHGTRREQTRGDEPRSSSNTPSPESCTEPPRKRQYPGRMPRRHLRHRGITWRLPCPALTFNPGYEPAVSAARLATYRAISQDDDHAWALYRWNIDLAAAFTALACDIEVTLRNTIHQQMTQRFERDDWWASNDLVLDDITTETLASVVQRHKKRLAKGSIGPGKIIADLMLGTWVMLLGRGGTSALGRAIDYETNLGAQPYASGSPPGPAPVPGVHAAPHVMQSTGAPPTCNGYGTVLRTTSPSSTGSRFPALRPGSTSRPSGTRQSSCLDG